MNQVCSTTQMPSRGLLKCKCIVVGWEQSGYALHCIALFGAELKCVKHKMFYHKITIEIQLRVTMTQVCTL